LLEKKRRQIDKKYQKTIIQKLKKKIIELDTNNSINFDFYI